MNRKDFGKIILLNLIFPGFFDPVRCCFNVLSFSSIMVAIPQNESMSLFFCSVNKEKLLPASTTHTASMGYLVLAFAFH